jgi:hypothetical protein
MITKPKFNLGDTIIVVNSYQNPNIVGKIFTVFGRGMCGTEWVYIINAPNIYGDGADTVILELKKSCESYENTIEIAPLALGEKNLYTMMEHLVHEDNGGLSLL